MKRLISFFLFLLIPTMLIAQNYKIDGDNSYIGIKYKSNTLNHLVVRLANIKGKASITRGKISNLGFKASLKNLSTGNEDRDEYLKESVFKTKKYKSIHFESMRIEGSPNGPVAKGLFTINGKSKGLIIPMTVTGPVTQENGKYRIGISSTVEISRETYQMVIVNEDEKISDTLVLDIQLQIISK